MELTKMEFKTPTIEDKEEIDRCILEDDTRSCDYATANIILWSPFYQVKYAIIDGLFVSHTDEEGGSFCYPLGKGDKKKVLQYLMDDCKEKQIPFVLHGVTHEMEDEFREMFGDIYEIEYDRDISEYIYDREKLATLSGKKLHGKRNHINRFKENHEWSYEPLSDENQLEVLAMLMEWKMQNCDPEDIEKHDEICVSKNSVINYKELGLVGGSEDGKSDHGIRCTNPEDAKIFCEKTGIDALAVAIGNAHGDYPVAPQLEFGVLEEIHDKTGIPLVLHGGSGITDADFQKAISLGIRKVNIATASFKSLTKEVENYLATEGAHNYFDMNEAMVLGTYKNVKHHIEVFNCK